MKLSQKRHIVEIVLVVFLVFTINLVVVIMFEIFRKKQSNPCGCRSNYEAKPFLYNSNNSKEFIMDDMILGPKDFAFFQGYKFANDVPFERWNYNSRATAKFTNNVEIPYAIHPSVRSEAHRNLIRVSLSNLAVFVNTAGNSRKYDGCLKFRDITDSKPRNLPKYYVNVVEEGNTCSSRIGRVHPQPQKIVLGIGCFKQHIIQHEFLHALGFYHEQNRPDRDDSIIVNWKNIKTGKCVQFKKCKGCTTFDFKYDLESIMHYQGHAHSCNSKPTMVRRLPGKGLGNENTILTATDIKKIRKYCGCKAYDVPEQNSCYIRSPQFTIIFVGIMTQFLL